MNASLYGWDAHAQDIRDLLIRETLEFSQRERDSLLGRERRDGTCDGAQPFSSLDTLSELARSHLNVLCEDLGGPSRGEHVQTAAGDDSIEPSAHRAIATKTGKAPPGTDESILGDVLGIRWGIEQPLSDLIDRGLVPPHDGCERFHVAVPGCFDQNRVIDLTARISGSAGEADVSWVPCTFNQRGDRLSAAFRALVNGESTLQERGGVSWSPVSHLTSPLLKTPGPVRP